MSKLLSLNVNDHTEAKNGLTYLSWAWAWSQVLKLDEEAVWEVVEHDGLPVRYLADTSALVKVSVTIKNQTKTCWLPVMDHRNRAIKNPDSFAVNTSIMRCLTKAIGMFGLGLYLYAGEDLPPVDEERLGAFAAELAALHDEGLTMEAVALWYGSPDIKNSNESREFVWLQLKDYSALRSAIKANKPATIVKEVA